MANDIAYSSKQQEPKITKNISLFILLALFAIIVSLRIIYTPYNILSWDVFGYYLYLPAKFIFHDIGLSDQTWLYKSINTYHQTPDFYQLYPALEGKMLIKYSIGLSILYSPFFFAAHIYALITGYPADGFSEPYQYFMVACALFYTLIGLIFLRKILLKYFDDKLTAILLIITVLGTNYINNTTIGGLMSHNFLFTLFAVFLWYTIRWCETGKLKHLLAVSIAGGLILISRPNEAVCLIIPLLWGVKDVDSFKVKLIFLYKNKYRILLALILFIIVVSPQLIYWKTVTGSFITYSYQNPGEGLDLSSPYTFSFLFSFRKGWLIYTPIVVFAIYGLFYLYKRNKEIFFASVIYLILSIYLVSSWTCWWYAGGCYSQRAIISTYVILAIPLGMVIKELIKKGFLLKLSFFFIVFLLICLNLFQFWQFQKGIISSDRMTRKYYFSVFGRTSIPKGAEKDLLVDRFSHFDETQLPKLNAKVLGKFDFIKKEGNSKDKLVKNPLDTNEYCLKMDGGNIYSEGINIKYKDITGKYYAWVKASADFYFLDDSYDGMPVFVTHFTHQNGLYDYQTTDINTENIKPGCWQTHTAYYLTPEVRNINDSLSVYIWHRGTKPFYVKNFLIQALEPKEN
jgi:hypothetical protein